MIIKALVSPVSRDQMSQLKSFKRGSVRNYKKEYDFNIVALSEKSYDQKMKMKMVVQSVLPWGEMLRVEGFTYYEGRTARVNMDLLCKAKPTDDTPSAGKYSQGYVEVAIAIVPSVQNNIIPLG